MTLAMTARSASTIRVLTADCPREPRYRMVTVRVRRRIRRETRRGWNGRSSQNAKEFMRAVSLRAGVKESPLTGISEGQYHGHPAILKGRPEEGCQEHRRKDLTPGLQADQNRPNSDP